MRLRKLELKDVELMLEWMHDPSVVEGLQTDFASKTIQDCENFIVAAQDGSKDFHLAIVNDEDEYMGTVSLKHIQNGSAEFAITVRKLAMGKGYSKYAMTKIIRIGFEKLNLQFIYWCVSPENKRAVRFYDKNGYQRIDGSFLDNRGGATPVLKSHLIYGIRKPERENNFSLRTTKYEFFPLSGHFMKMYVGRRKKYVFN
jgi:diamine N-acetyltransferase